MSIVGFLGFVVAVFLSGSPSGAESPMHMDFDSFEVDAPPPGFTTALSGGGGAAAWVVRDDASAPSGRKTLVQTSTEPTSHRFPLCIYDGLSVADVTVSTMFKAISGSVDQAAGIIWRYQDPDHYYVVRANALEGNVVLYKMHHGKRTDLKPVDAGWLSYGKKVPVPPDHWHALRLAVRGKRFTVFVNGEHVLDVEDDTFTAAGKVGLWTKADSVTAFDDLSISPAEAR